MRLAPFRVGSVPYLNAAPLTFGLEQEIAFVPPSQLAVELHAGRLDAALVSLTEVLFALPDATTVWPGHDYQGRSHSTIGQEKASNARVAGKTEADVRRVLIDARAERSEADDIRSTITVDAGTQNLDRPEASPIVAAVKKLTAQA